MLLKLNLPDFYLNFLNILVDINKDGKNAIFAKDGQLSAITTINNNSIYFYNTYTPLEIIDPVARFNINLQKLKVALSCINNTQQIDLKFEDNKVSYKDDEMKFDIRLLSDNVVAIPAFNIITFNALSYSFTATLNKESLSKIKNGDSFCGETNKFYIKTENNKIIITFGDKQNQQNNEMRISLDIPFNGVCDESVFDSSILRLLFKERKDISMKINDKVLVFETKTDNSQQIYITSRLKK